MNPRYARFLTILIAVSLGALSSVTPAAAMQAEPTLAAESCIAYREDNEGGYRLSNACDYVVDIAFCSQPKNDPGLCVRTQSWTRETLRPNTEGVQKVWPEQALDLFACRTPGKVEILPSGMARCSSPPLQPAIPWLVSASLKNPGSIVTNNDYPMNSHPKDGTTRFELLVGPDGRPLECKVVVSAGAREYDDAACKAFMRRARFSPAKDEAGKPTTGRYKGSVTWKAP